MISSYNQLAVQSPKEIARLVVLAHATTVGGHMNKSCTELLLDNQALISPQNPRRFGTPYGSVWVKVKLTGKGSRVNAWSQAIAGCILGKQLHQLGMNPPPKSRRSVAGTDIRLSERSWIDAAFEHIIKSNFSDLRVEALARELEVTKGSFYWHFRDRRHLLERVLEHWTEIATIRITQWSASESADGVERLVRLLSLPANTPPDRRGAEVELAVRSWARRDETAAKTVAKVDSMRFNHFVEIIAELGFSDHEARRRASIAQAFMLGDAFLRSGLTPAQRTENARACAEMVAR